MTPTKILRGDKNQCPTCGHYFNSSVAFSKHRTGDFTTGQRRCLTTDEMLTRGMSVSSAGYWITKAMPEGMR
ncbi:hypothetical protein MCERE10_01812 [Burkholderiaceae bacterium]